MKHRQQSRITFIEKDGILYPDLTLPKQKEIGRFGHLRVCPADFAINPHHRLLSHGIGDIVSYYRFFDK